jgi:hypothetical protein
MLHLNINNTASFNHLLRDGRMPILCHDIERRGLSRQRSWWSRSQEVKTSYEADSVRVRGMRGRRRKASVDGRKEGEWAMRRPEALLSSSFFVKLRLFNVYSTFVSFTTPRSASVLVSW